MKRQIMAMGLGGLILLAACGPKSGEQRAEGQKNEPVNIAQDVFGGVELLEKPVEPRALIDAIARACGRADPSRV
jgi:hypothetical protein